MSEGSAAGPAPQFVHLEGQPLGKANTSSGREPGPATPPEVGQASGTSLPQCDVVVCGGTLGVVMAAALMAQRPGLKTVVLERGPLRGRAQEWNISRKELQEIVEVKIGVGAGEGEERE